MTFTLQRCALSHYFNYEQPRFPLYIYIYIILLIDFKNSKWLTYLCILLCICYCLSHLIGLFSDTWLSLLYKFTRFFIYFLFLSDEGPLLDKLYYTIRISSTPTILYFDFYLYSAYAAHYVYFNFGSFTFGSFTAATLCLISNKFFHSLPHEMVSHLIPFLTSISKLAPSFIRSHFI